MKAIFGDYQRLIPTAKDWFDTGQKRNSRFCGDLLFSHPLQSVEEQPEFFHNLSAVGSSYYI